MACELFDGDLHAFIKGANPFTSPAFFTDGTPLERLKLAIEVAIQAAQGLAFVHEQNYVHKDIKPKNFVVRKGLMEKGEPKWVCKLTDLGFSRRIVEGGSCCDPTTRLGTIDWIAPELIEERQHQQDLNASDDSISTSSIASLMELSFSSKSDVWSFGCVLCFIFVKGQHPYGDNEKVRLENIPKGQLTESGQTILNEMNQLGRFEIKKLIDQMIQRDPNQRPKMPQVLEMMKQWAPIEPVSFNMEQPIRVSRSRSSSSTN